MVLTFDPKKLDATCQLLKNADPAAYEQLLRLLDQWTFDVTAAVTEAPSSEILQAQGRAQQMIKVTRVFSEALNLNRATP